MKTIIETRQLTKTYRKETVVKHIDMYVPEGAIYGFLGPNGAGKTTTMRMILGLAQPTCGDVALFGRVMNHSNRMRILMDVGSLIESPSYYGHLTGRENLGIIAKLRNLGEADIDRALKTVRLSDQGDKLVREYSLGMKQRLGIATAILSRPKLLILDEPVNGLDPAGMQEMRELIRSLPERYGSTILISSHLLSEVDQLATHIGVIVKGEMVFQDKLAALRAKSDARIMLRTSNDEAALTLLIDARQMDGNVILPDTSDDALSRISLNLAKAGIGIIRMERHENSLEQIFLELTGSAVSL